MGRRRNPYYTPAWLMSQAEFLHYALRPENLTVFSSGDYKSVLRFAGEDKLEVVGRNRQELLKFLKEIHRDFVLDAVHANRPVPKENLQQYDVAPRYRYK